MDRRHAKLLLRLLAFLFLSGASRTEGARVFTIVNYCKTTIWPGITPGEFFDGGGFALRPGESAVFTAPVGWIGRIWGRTGCQFDSDGTGSCHTGACGNVLKCVASGQTPATLAEFTLASLDFFDVSLVDGFNLPMTVTPANAQDGGNCSAAGCDDDLRDSCPAELAVKADGQTSACRSACDVFNADEYCCRGAFGLPDSCQPTTYSKLFKKACPAAYSYAYDDPTSIFTCAGADYTVSFCSKSSIQKRRQRVCTYHINKLICSGSLGRASTGKWLLASAALMLLCELVAAIIEESFFSVFSLGNKVIQG